MPTYEIESSQTSIPTASSSKMTITTKCEDQMTKIKEEVQVEISDNQPSQTSMATTTTNKWPQMMIETQSTGHMQQQKEEEEEGHPIVIEQTTASTSALSTTNVPLMSKSGLWIMHRDTDGTPYYYHRETRFAHENWLYFLVIIYFFKVKLVGNCPKMRNQLWIFRIQAIMHCH